MWKFFRFSLALVFLFPVLSCATSKTPLRAPSSDLYALDEIATRLEAVVAPQVGGSKNVGAIVGIYDRGEIRFLSFGETKKGNEIAPDKDTVFEIGSLTKTYTGLLMAIGVESGQIQESDRLDSFNSEWLKQGTADITLLELITHRSGLPRLPCNLHFSDPRRPYADYDEADLIAGLKDSAFGGNCTLGVHPSADLAYSNWGFGLLGYLLSKKASLSYPQFLKLKITDPLGLKDTVYELSSDQMKRLAQGYDQNLQEAPLWDRKILFGNGAIRSTAVDVLKYAQYYLHPESSSISDAIRRAMKLQFQSSDQRIAYAWNVTPAGSIWHNGIPSTP